MRKMILMKYCGVDWVEDRREVEATFSTTVNGRDLDLCEEHASKIPIKLLGPTVAKYGTQGVVTGSPKPKKEHTEKDGGEKAELVATPDGEVPSMQCPLCDHVARSRAGAPRSALGQHLHQAHDTTLRELIKQGKVEPVPIGAAARKV